MNMCDEGGYFNLRRDKFALKLLQLREQWQASSQPGILPSNWAACWGYSQIQSSSQKRMGQRFQGVQSETDTANMMKLIEVCLQLQSKALSIFHEKALLWCVPRLPARAINGKSDIVKRFLAYMVSHYSLICSIAHEWQSCYGSQQRCSRAIGHTCGHKYPYGVVQADPEWGCKSSPENLLE